MIRKITSIENLAVFRKFDWDKCVLDKKGDIHEFQEINIIYGRNYSGKTTLSRIFRAIENESISDKFENPNFCVNFKDNSEIRCSKLVQHGKNVRVFNEDFIRDNLKFIINPDENIEAFAILGNSNTEIEDEIRELESELGSNESGKETGLYYQYKTQSDKYNLAQKNHQNHKSRLDNQLHIKATDRESGIKYQFEKYGQQNYSKPVLENEINKVLQSNFRIITKQEQNDLEKLLLEKINPNIPVLPKIDLKIIDLSIQTKILVEKKIGKSEKIEELVHDAILRQWVNEGRKLHKNKRTECAFCGNKKIDDNRWIELEKHFDIESEELENDIDTLINKIDFEIKLIRDYFKSNKIMFYSKFHDKIDRLSTLFDIFSENHILNLGNLRQQLVERKNNLISPQIYNCIINQSKRLNWILEIYDSLRVKSNSYSSSLANDQLKAKDSLRLKEVFDFANTINYLEELSIINDLKTNEEEVKSLLDATIENIKRIKQLIEDKRGEMQDEKVGADKVNEYLNNFFGNGFLSLKPVEFQTGGDYLKKNVRFEIVRNGKKAYHLSGGECSLIAFCYFIAKLDDIKTKGVKPIIWIDDPITSLDNNHIFFVYSLISSEIISKNIFEQIFISTHNLDFLKYLRRLTGWENNKEYTKTYFSIHRQDKDSIIQLMPEYLKKYVTEFNYLFKQIYECSEIEIPDDSNYTLFYNFGNNARKFLEIYLYYKYPDNTSEAQKLQNFFGGEKIPTILIDRINNEYSHLSGVFERGGTPVEVPEMKLTAKSIIDRIKTIDKNQYDSLLNSIKGN